MKSEAGFRPGAAAEGSPESRIREAANRLKELLPQLPEGRMSGPLFELGWLVGQVGVNDAVESWIHAERQNKEDEEVAGELERAINFALENLDNTEQQKAA